MDTQADMAVVVIDQIQSHDSCLRITGAKQVDQNPGDLIPFGNEPQGCFSVKPAGILLADSVDLNSPINILRL